MTGKLAYPPHILIVEGRYFEALADSFLEGAISALEEAGATYQVVTVPGVLEIAVAISYALDAEAGGGTEFDGYVALGTVIHDEALRFDVLAGEAYRALSELAVSESLAIGNGIVTVTNEAQAWACARRHEKDYGGFAARAALTMIELQRKLGA